MITRLGCWIGLTLACLAGGQLRPAEAEESFPRPRIDWDPAHYVCYRTPAPLVIDGRLDDAAWQQAPWTTDFVDILGDRGPVPRFRTRARMLWDAHYFYIGAELEEPDVWGTLTTRDAVIFHDNDFEVFIDPDGDTHEYYELEINALGTEWDLLLIKPYRDGGPAIDAWDIQGLATAVAIDGTLNQPGDEDRGWSVEIAMPWAVLEECAHRPAPPSGGDQWRVNFSRVEWQAAVDGGKHVKRTDPATGKPLPEDNWVWSPQGLIAMHYPEMWGVVQFSDHPVGTTIDDYLPAADSAARRTLCRIYYEQRDWHARHGAYTDDLAALGMVDAGPSGYHWPPQLTVTPNLFEVSLTSLGGTIIRISQDGHIW